MQHTGILTTPKNSHKTGDLLSGDGLLFFIFQIPKLPMQQNYDRDPGPLFRSC